MNRRERIVTVLAATLALAAAGCAPAPPEQETVVVTPAGADGQPLKSLAGEPLPPLSLDARFVREQTDLLRDARARLAAEPDNPDAWIWTGRRTAYLGRYPEAIALFTDGIRAFPTDARMYRHRGHRFITTRQLDKAVADLLRAARLIEGTDDRVEPDGLPNERNQPTSTLHGNIWYHLGLAYYLQGKFHRALEAYRQDLAVARNPDSLCATSHWLYMTLRRLGREEEAAAVLEPIHAEMDIIENHAYHRLLLAYKGEIDMNDLWKEATGEDDAVQSATLGYGVGNWFLYSGDAGRAGEIFRKILEGSNWAAFGYIAAEAELARGVPGAGA